MIAGCGFPPNAFFICMSCRSNVSRDHTAIEHEIDCPEIIDTYRAKLKRAEKAIDELWERSK